MMKTQLTPYHRRNLSLRLQLRKQTPRHIFLLIPPGHHNLAATLQRHSHKVFIMSVGDFKLARVGPVCGLQAQEGRLGGDGAVVIGTGEDGEGIFIVAEACVEAVGDDYMAVLGLV